MKRLVAIWLATGWLAAAQARADPLEKLDPQRYGAGTLLWAMEQIESYLPPQAADALKALLSHGDHQVARAAARLLRRMGLAADSAQAAATVLADAQAAEAARFSVALALGELRDAACVGPLSGALSGEVSERVRARAALSLGELGRPGLTAQLQPAANDVSPLVRAASARALALLPDATADQLIAMLSDQDARVRREAVWGLGQARFAGQPAVVGRLTQALQQDADCRVRAEAAWALAELGDPSAVAALQAVSEQPCRMAAQAAVAALDRLK